MAKERLEPRKIRKKEFKIIIKVKKSVDSQMEGGAVEDFRPKQKKKNMLGFMCIDTYAAIIHKQVEDREVGKKKVDTFKNGK